MTVHARRIASVPIRTASETWRAICDLIAPHGSAARSDLDAATGLGSMLIAEEYSADDPIIVSGSGPQLRLYTLHSDEALETEAEEDPLAFDPTAGDWKMSLPCGEVDLSAAQSAARKFDRVEVRALGAVANTAATVGTRTRPVIDLAELERE